MSLLYLKDKEGWLEGACTPLPGTFSFGQKQHCCGCEYHGRSILFTGLSFVPSTWPVHVSRQTYTHTHTRTHLFPVPFRFTCRVFNVLVLTTITPPDEEELADLGRGLDLQSRSKIFVPVNNAEGRLSRGSHW